MCVLTGAYYRGKHTSVRNLGSQRGGAYFKVGVFWEGTVHTYLSKFCTTQFSKKTVYLCACIFLVIHACMYSMHMFITQVHKCVHT